MYVAVNTNDAFMGIDSESLYGGSKSFPPAFDAGENYERSQNVLYGEVLPLPFVQYTPAFCAIYLALVYHVP